MRERSPDRLRAVQQTIEGLLPDPTLVPGTVAAIHRMSTRQLHRLFAPTGTSFCRYVLARRLDLCRGELADPRSAGLPLTEIAFRWGFSDSSHFSRCFRAAFGCTARDFRARHLAHRPQRFGRPEARPDQPADVRWVFGQPTSGTEDWPLLAGDGKVS